MKILHICLASFYIDNYSYQENILPKFHKKMSYDVEIIASLISFDKNGKSCLLEKGSQYNNEYNIPVTRLDYKNSKFSKRLRQYRGTYEAIVKANPDIIFIHGCQFLDIKYVVKFAKLNPNFKIFIDNHADFSNSAKNFLSKNILHKVIWRYCAHLIEPYVTKFYGVLPARVDFLVDTYKLPINKVELLVMGADDERVEEAKSINKRRNLRKKYGIEESDFLIMTGGKIDHNKPQTLLLMEAVKNLNLNHNQKKVKLIVFGSVVPEFKDKLESFLCDSIKYIGWIDSKETYKHFNLADLVVFPGLHSVFWEQVVGLGVPCVFKYIEGFTHINVGGNCKYLFEDSVSEITKVLSEIIINKELYQSMKKASKDKGMEEFSYKKIAEKSIYIK